MQKLRDNQGETSMFLKGNERVSGREVKKCGRYSFVSPRVVGSGSASSRLFTQDLNNVGPLEGAVVFHEVDGLAGAPHDFPILDCKEAVDPAQQALQMRVGVEAEPAVEVQITPVVVILVLREEAREVGEDVFLKAGDAFGDQQAGRGVQGHHIDQAILDTAVRHNRIDLGRDVDGFFGLPALNLYALKFDDHGGSPIWEFRADLTIPPESLLTTAGHCRAEFSSGTLPSVPGCATRGPCS